MVALHDLHGMGDPVDRREERLRLAGGGRGLQAKGHLWLDTRLDESLERHEGAAVPRKDQGAIVYGAPHGLVNAVAGPKGAVGEADLAADRLPTPGHAMAMQGPGRGVGGLG